MVAPNVHPSLATHSPWPGIRPSSQLTRPFFGQALTCSHSSYRRVTGPLPKGVRAADCKSGHPVGHHHSQPCPICAIHIISARSLEASGQLHGHTLPWADFALSPTRCHSGWDLPPAGPGSGVPLPCHSVRKTATSSKAPQPHLLKRCHIYEVLAMLSSLVPLHATPPPSGSPSRIPAL